MYHTFRSCFIMIIAATIVSTIVAIDTILASWLEPVKMLAWPLVWKGSSSMRRTVELQVSWMRSVGWRAIKV